MLSLTPSASILMPLVVAFGILNFLFSVFSLFSFLLFCSVSFFLSLSRSSFTIIIPSSLSLPAVLPLRHTHAAATVDRIHFAQNQAGKRGYTGALELYAKTKRIS